MGPRKARRTFWKETRCGVSAIKVRSNSNGCSARISSNEFASRAHKNKKSYKCVKTQSRTAMCLFKSLRFSSVWFHHFSKYFYVVLSSAGQPGESFHFFNLSSFGRDERMIKAQFRWFRKKRKFCPGSFHTPHFYKVNASCLLAFKDISSSLFSYIVQETLWQCFGALTITKCTHPVSVSASIS